MKAEELQHQQVSAHIAMMSMHSCALNRAHMVHPVAANPTEFSTNAVSGK